MLTQTDAKGQVLWFKYDLLNRLQEKRRNNSTGTLLAGFSYDTATNGIGRRAAMSNTIDATSWVYDLRGRVKSENRTISGVSVPFVTAFDYDAADRMISSTYPSGEVVTMTYDNAGQAYSTAGWNTYVLRTYANVILMGGLRRN